MLCWFSCGAASAVATKEAIDLYSDSHSVIPVCCDTRPSEHSDNYRFSADCERWFNRPIIYLRSEDYATIDEVFERTRYMAGRFGARCTTEQKKIPRLKYQLPDDVHVWGYTYSEIKRINDFKARNPDIKSIFILRDRRITKNMCLARLTKARIVLPMMYRIFDTEDRQRFKQDGFDNNNCPGCVKASSPWYWSMIRKYFPDVFKRRCEQSRAINCRLVQLNGERIFLDELPDKVFKKNKKNENLSCGPECGAPPIQSSFDSSHA